MKIIVDIKTCNDCKHKSHTGAFTTGGAKPCCNHPETCKLLGHDCFKRVIPYRTVHDDNIHRVYREPKSIPKWCPLRKNQVFQEISITDKVIDNFIEKCNIFPLVSAKEGGVIELESILNDFIKYVKTNK